MISCIHLIYFLLVGLAAGWLAGKIMMGHSFSLAGNLAVGVVGAILGGFLFQILGLVTIGLPGNLVCATVGAVVFLLLLQKFGRRA